MLQMIAKSLSIVFHPLLIPTLGLAIVFLTAPYITLLPMEAKGIILLVVVANTVALPLLMIHLFYRLGLIQSLQMHTHRERIIPLLFTLIPFGFSYYFLQRLPIPGIIPMYMFGATLVLGATLLVTLWWKISIHMVGMGGLVGAIHVLAYLLLAPGVAVLVCAIILSGLVAWARLRLNAHTPQQVYLGFALGWVGMGFTILTL